MGGRLTRRSLLAALTTLPAYAFAPWAEETSERPRSSKELRDMFEQYLKQKAAEITDNSLRGVSDLRAADWEIRSDSGEFGCRSCVDRNQRGY